MTEQRKETTRKSSPSSLVAAMMNRPRMDRRRKSPTTTSTMHSCIPSTTAIRSRLSRNSNSGFASSSSSTTQLLVLLLVLIASTAPSATVLAKLLQESKRVQEYRKRNYTWPVETYLPNTSGWRQLFESRFAQVSEIEDTFRRYEGYLQTVHAAYHVPNFTAHGFGLARAPTALWQELQQAIRNGLHNATHEDRIDLIEGPHAPLYIDRPDLTSKVLHGLLPYVEAWSGVAVEPATAYGFRLYQNQSTLLRHVDRTQTHVLSFILHIDSSDDAAPWPLVIEGFDGRTYQVILTPGDMLFYESSKCFHGRPQPFNGSWYTSVFVHYYPVHWQETDHTQEQHYAIPPEWIQPPPSSSSKSTQPKLQMVGSSLYEPECPHGCCPCQDAVQWSGPGEEGVWIAPNRERIPFHPQVAAFGTNRGGGGGDATTMSEEL